MKQVTVARKTQMYEKLEICQPEIMSRRYGVRSQTLGGCEASGV